MLQLPITVDSNIIWQLATLIKTLASYHFLGMYFKFTGMYTWKKIRLSNRHFPSFEVDWLMLRQSWVECIVMTTLHFITVIWQLEAIYDFIILFSILVFECFEFVSVLYGIFMHSNSPAFLSIVVLAAGGSNCISDLSGVSRLVGCPHWAHLPQIWFINNQILSWLQLRN